MCYDISFTAKLRELPNYFPELVDSPQLSFDFGSDHIIAHRYRMPLFLSLDLSKQWIEPDLPEAQYREILNYEMPQENMNYTPVWTIRSPKPRPDGKSKTEFWEWKDLTALGEKNPPELTGK